MYEYTYHLHAEYQRLLPLPAPAATSAIFHCGMFHCRIFVFFMGKQSQTERFLPLPEKES